jgi:hypothetical protein
VNVEEIINPEEEKRGNDKANEIEENERVEEDKDKKDKNEEEINNKDKKDKNEEEMNNKDKTKCTLCDKTFSKKGLKAHVTKKH